MQKNINMQDDYDVPGVGPGSYTMGVKFQIRTDVDKNLIHKVYLEENKRITGGIFALGIIALILSFYLKYTYGPAGPGVRVLVAALLIIVAGVLSPRYLPEIRFYRAKKNKETGPQKMTVFEEECLVYAEDFQATHSMRFQDVVSYERLGVYYVLKWPEMTFAFCEKDFLVGDIESFDSFMHQK